MSTWLQIASVCIQIMQEQACSLQVNTLRLQAGLEKVPTSQGLDSVTYPWSFDNTAIKDITENAAPSSNIATSNVECFTKFYECVTMFCKRPTIFCKCFIMLPNVLIVSRDV